MATQRQHGPALLDMPLEQLPAVDEHSIEIDAPAEQAWAALLPVLEATLCKPSSRRFAELLGCAVTEASGDRSHPGGTLPGFTVSRAIPPVMLALVGRHRFSSYALVFRIDLLPEHRCRVRAETRASFPGGRGRVYRMLVIGSRGHVLAVRSMLRAIRKRAERGDLPG
jgi:hypothetical protein